MRSGLVNSATASQLREIRTPNWTYRDEGDGWRRMAGKSPAQVTQWDVEVLECLWEALRGVAVGAREP